MNIELAKQMFKGTKGDRAILSEYFKTFCKEHSEEEVNAFIEDIFECVFCKGNDKIKDFYPSKVEVTQELYEAVMGINPSSNNKGGRYPVEMVSYDDAEAFIKKLNEELFDGTPYQVDLIDENEWKWAFIGGEKTKNFQYAGSDNPLEVGWFSENSDNHSHEVAQLKPNELGLYDMSGNLCEWLKHLPEYDNE